MIRNNIDRNIGVNDSNTHNHMVSSVPVRPVDNKISQKFPLLYALLSSTEMIANGLDPQRRYDMAKKDLSKFTINNVSYLGGEDFPMPSSRKVNQISNPPRNKDIDGCITTVVEAYTGAGNAVIYQGINALPSDRTDFCFIRDSIIRDLYSAYHSANISLSVLEDKRVNGEVYAYLAYALDIKAERVLSIAYERLLISAKKITAYLSEHIASGMSRNLFFEKREKHNRVSEQQNIKQRNVNMIKHVCDDPLNRMLFNLDFVKEAYLRLSGTNVEAVGERIAMKLVHLASQATIKTLDFALIDNADKIYHSNAGRLLFLDELARWEPHIPCEYEQNFRQLKAYLAISTTSMTQNFSMGAIVDYLRRDEMARTDVLLANTETLTFYLRDIGKKLGQRVQESSV